MAALPNPYENKMFIMKTCLVSKSDTAFMSYFRTHGINSPCQPRLQSSLPHALPQQSSTLPVASAMPNLSSNLLLPSFIFFFHISWELLELLQSCVSAKHFACTLYHCPVIPLIQSEPHSHRTTSSTPFTLTRIYISCQSALKSDLNYTDASLSLKFLFRRLIFELFVFSEILAKYMNNKRQSHL